ncbi:hypothetical protein CIW47_06750 [Mycolicibacterium sp. P1-5]|nr:hypothetical protein CIW47_06750 [Mycolicibacterium sp. P1-5]
MVGAGAIALAPIHPVALPFSEINVPAAVSNASVELAALPSLIAPWVDLLTGAVTNAGVLGTALLADPVPVARQAAQNWIGYGDILSTALGGAATGLYGYLSVTLPEDLKTAAQQIAAGHPSEAAGTINYSWVQGVLAVGEPFFAVMEVPGTITDNLTAAVKSVTGIETLFNVLLAAIGPPTGVIQATGDSAQVIVDSLGAGDYTAAAVALFNLPPTLLGAVINGYSPPGGSIMPGLLTPPDASGYNAGLAYTLLVTIPRTIATAIGAPAPPAAARIAKPAASLQAAAGTETTDSTDSTSSTDATTDKSGSSNTGVAGSRRAGAKSDATGKKSSGAKKSTAAKSERPQARSGRAGGGSAAG